MCSLLWLAGFTASSVHAESLRILLLLSNNNSSYQAFSSALQQQLPTAELHSSSVDDLSHNPLLLENSDVIVALGLSAAEQAGVGSNLPMLSVFIPQAIYNPLLAKIKSPARANQMGVIYLNQAPAREAAFISALLPQQHKIGVLYSASVNNELGGLREALKFHASSLTAQAVQVDDSLFHQLENLLNQTDVLLAMPDNALYSSSNLRNILLTTYRFGIPVVGFLPSYVNAGAVGAIFASPEQIAQQAALFIQQAQLSGHWNSAQYADTFSIALNTQIARSLDLTLPSEAEIRQRMYKALRSNHD